MGCNQFRFHLRQSPAREIVIFFKLSWWIFSISLTLRASFATTVSGWNRDRRSESDRYWKTINIGDNSHFRSDITYRIQNFMFL
jgi:hypothetical protein